MDTNWYILYTAPRSEKKIAERLMQLGYEIYLPIIETIRQWSDRKKKVSTVLFPSYLFIFGTKEKVMQALAQPGVVKFVNFKGDYATIKSSEIEAIKRLISTGSRFERIDVSLDKGSHVRVVEGPLAGLEGYMMSQPQKPGFMITLESISEALIVNIPANYIERIL